MSDENHEDDDSKETGDKSVTETPEEKTAREAKEAKEKEQKDKSQEKEKDDLAPIKEKLNKAFEERDNLAKELAEMKKKEREKEIERLNEEGKHKEAFEIQLKERDEKILQLETEIVGLTRDIAVRDEFRAFNFRNEKASALAYDSVIKELVQDEKGKWVHKSGSSISDFVKSFSEDEDNQFLFQPKVNSGAGGSPKTKPDAPSGEGKSYKDKPQSELLKDIRAGKVKPVASA